MLSWVLLLVAVSASETCNASPFQLPTEHQVLMGCVSYDPSVSKIWDKMKEYFHDQGIDFDYVLFSNYEQQVRALLDGQIDLAWNGPIAHCLAQESATIRGMGSVVSLGMRDADRVSD